QLGPTIRRHFVVQCGPDIPTRHRVWGRVFRRAWMAREGIVDRRDDYAFEDEQGEQRGARLLREVLEVAVITLVLFILVGGVVQNYRVEGPSMTPTLLNSQYILVDKVQYVFGSPKRGDVIVFKWPRDPSEDFVKRVIGVPGDTVHVDATGLVTVDGVVINE